MKYFYYLFQSQNTAKTNEIWIAESIDLQFLMPYMLIINPFRPEFTIVIFIHY